MRRQFAMLVLLLMMSGCATPTATAPAPQAVTIAFVGDILLTDGVLAGRGGDHPWARVAGQLKQADLAIGNLETAVSTRGTPVPNKQYTFRSAPGALAGAARAGIDVLSLANNHSGDYGPEALLDTIDHVKAAGIQPVGAGQDVNEAAKPVTLNVKGQTIAILAFTRVIPEADWVAGYQHPGLNPGWEPEPVLAAIRAARAQADAVIVLVHWGEEMKDRPRPTDIELADAMVKAGATVVAGHHPHVLQSIRHQGRSLVAYSLGNFIFTGSSSPLGRQSAILTVRLGRQGVTSARLTPLSIVAG
ncbi:MAG TPA: CapA family protein, partial [Symbiobacteriaceae bacterium]|nr:CapA family protein [Symbiobacteriaceae bacterium]